MIPTIEIESSLLEKCPKIKLGNLICSVQYRSEYPDLLTAIQNKSEALQAEIQTEDISQLPNNGATREAYKSCGKKPGRYRPSAEALLRRVLSGKGLYAVNNIVDALNLVSISTGFSIGGYDFDKIKGDIRLGIGKENEPYAAIGRGELNIANLPIFRDDISAFGTPTSDSLRSSVDSNIKIFWMVFYSFDGNMEELNNGLDLAEQHLTNFASAKSFERWIV